MVLIQLLKTTKMKKMNLSLFVIASMIACNNEPPDTEGVISFYENAHPKIITSEETGITYEFMAKMTNNFDEPVVVPYIQYHQLPIEQSFDCVVRNDSLVDISFGTPSGDFSYFGIDTLYPNETQRNFVFISSYDKKVRRSKYKIFDFKYYFLKDYAKGNSDEKNAKHEYFIFFQDSIKNNFKIYKAEGLDLKTTKSIPIPK